MKIVVFTDLDGTLLDSRSYSFSSALPALRLLSEHEIPLVLCSSKTRVEIEYYREKLENRHPFISENGGGIFMPKGYFKVAARPLKIETTVEDQYQVIRLGADYESLRSALSELREAGYGYSIKGFGDMTVQEVSDLTGLNIQEAEMAKQRDFDEPFLYDGPAEQLKLLLHAIETKGFRHTRGHFLHIMGESDKGKALTILKDFYRATYGKVITIAIGDSLNDLPMLKNADYPIVVQKPDGSYDPRLDIPNLIKANGLGPQGWNKAVTALIKELLTASTGCGGHCNEPNLKK